MVVNHQNILVWYGIGIPSGGTVWSWSEVRRRWLVTGGTLLAGIGTGGIICFHRMSGGQLVVSKTLWSPLTSTGGTSTNHAHH